MCWFWFGPAAAGLGLLALGDLLTNSSVPEDHKRFTLVCVAAGAVVVMFLGLSFVYDTVRCGIFWCGSLADIQTSRYVSHGIQLLICASGLLAICIVSLVRRLEKRRELPSKDLAELTREARMRRIRMGVALAVVVIPSLLLMTTVLPRMLSFTATGISTEMLRPSIDEFDEAYMKSNNVRVAGVVLHFYPYTLILALLTPHLRVMGLGLPSGGHLTHGYYTAKKKISATFLYFESLPYSVHPEMGILEYEELRKQALFFRPAMILCGASAYPRTIDSARFRAIADEVDAILMVDIAHISGLVATKQHSSPFEHCDVVTTTTHKSLRGPRAGMIT